VVFHTLYLINPRPLHLGHTANPGFMASPPLLLLDVSRRRLAGRDVL
jgi:hypothetical protein